MAWRKRNCILEIPGSCCWQHSHRFDAERNWLVHDERNACTTRSMKLEVTRRWMMYAGTESKSAICTNRFTVVKQYLDLTQGEALKQCLECFGGWVWDECLYITQWMTCIILTAGLCVDSSYPALHNKIVLDRSLALGNCKCCDGSGPSFDARVSTANSEKNVFAYFQLRSQTEEPYETSSFMSIVSLQQYCLVLVLEVGRPLYKLLRSAECQYTV